MDEIKWVRLIEVNMRMDAELVQSFLNAHGIETYLVKESYESTAYGFPVTRVEILVPNFQLKQALKLYEESGWDFDITETDDEDEEDDS